MHRFDRLSFPAATDAVAPRRLPRVSTARQGHRGLGLAAQNTAIRELADRANATVVAAFTEIESGRRADRPALTKAIRLTGATLAIARLDRLSRNAAFLLTLHVIGVRFLAADMPEANDLTVGIMALVAQRKREAIARRTREALSAARARGTRLGNPNGADALRRAERGNEAILQAIADNADAFAGRMPPVMGEMNAGRAFVPPPRTQPPARPDPTRPPMARL